VRQYIGGELKVKLGDELLERLRRAARRRGLTMAEMLRELVDQATGPIRETRKLPRPVIGCAVCLVAQIVPVPAAVAVVDGFSVCAGCATRAPMNFESWAMDRYAELVNARNGARRG
jgi:hypothetical protein